MQASETPIEPADRKEAGDPSRATKVPHRETEVESAPQSSKSYTPTPSKPEKGGTVPRPATTP